MNMTQPLAVMSCQGMMPVDMVVLMKIFIALFVFGQLF